jgi:hypothetical protein
VVVVVVRALLVETLNLLQMVLEAQVLMDCNSVHGLRQLAFLTMVVILPLVVVVRA